MKKHVVLKNFLEQTVKKYNKKEFLDTDPISIVHKISGDKNRETAAFIVSIFAFGNVKSIKTTIQKVLQPMGDNAYGFIKNYKKDRTTLFKGIVHRFIKEYDISCLINALHSILKEYGSIKDLFMRCYNKVGNMRKVAEGFSKISREIYRKNNDNFSERTLRFMLPSPENGSACKRMNLFLRWMVRKDEIDLGIWKGIEKNQLIIPLDTHIARISKSLGLTKRKTPGWNMAEEITENLKKFDPNDPLKYDFALTRVGMLNPQTHQLLYKTKLGQ